VRPTLPFLTALAAAFLLGCASTERYDALLNSLIGSSEADLLLQWGRPVRTYDSGGFHYVVYQVASTTYVTGMATSYQPVSKAGEMHDTAIGGSPDLPIELACITTFELSNGMVVNWSHKGNHCKAK
jgi:hypothetical protein